MTKMSVQFAKPDSVLVHQQQQPQESSSINSRRVHVYIQTTTDKVMQLYESIPKMVNKSNDTRLAILKSTRVRPQALTLGLKDYAAMCECVKLKQDEQNVIYSVENMFPGGETRLFVHHTNRDVNSEMEFICVAVRMYDISEKVACDFCLPTYSYSKSQDTNLSQFGDSAMNASMVFGALSISPGNISTLFSALCGGLSVILALVGATAYKIANDTQIAEDLKEFLEANFLYELVSRGHAFIGENRKLYITNE